MRLVRYNVAASLDGFIADANGAFDWIPDDPAVDFAALFANVDTVLLGRRSWELVEGGTETPWPPGTRVYVFSRTLGQAPREGVRLVADDAAGVVARLRAEPGSGDIWLFGGGELAGALFAAGQVDRVEVTVVPVMLGAGVPLAAALPHRVKLDLLGTHRYPSGMVTLGYRVSPLPARPS
jgi:dihydrofolate reductase